MSMTCPECGDTIWTEASDFIGCCVVCGNYFIETENDEDEAMQPKMDRQKDSSRVSMSQDDP